MYVYIYIGFFPSIMIARGSIHTSRTIQAPQLYQSLARSDRPLAARSTAVRVMASPKAAKPMASFEMNAMTN